MLKGVIATKMLISTFCIFTFVAGISSASESPCYGSNIERLVLPLFAIQPVDEKLSGEETYVPKENAHQDTEVNDMNETLQEESADEKLLRNRRKANPDQDQNKDGDRGGVEVQVNRERNHGTRVDATATGKIWESRDGNGRLEAQGHYGRTYGGRQGTGRPEYGGSINYSHRFRREANPDQDQNKDGGRGGVEVQVNRERNQGTRVDATATGKIWESRDGNGRLEAQGHYGRTYGGRQGTGRPEYGGSINYSHRFRREANPDQDQNKDGGRGGVEVQVNRERNQGTRVDATATGKIWESRDGNGRLEAQGHYGRTYGGRQGTGRPEYGGSINYSHRFRREANPDQDQNKDGGRGGVEVQVNRERNQGTRVDATATGKIWESRDGNGRLEAQGHYGRTYGGRQGTGRPEYGGSINYSHRFRREANPDQDQNKDGGRGGVEVQVNRERNQGTRVDATATGKIWESRDGNGRLEAQGHYGRTYGGRQGTGRPEYGGSINYSHRVRREANPDQDQNKDGGRGGVEVQVNRERNQGTRVDATATGKIWESRDGNGRLEAQGHYGRTYGGRQGTGRPEYGGSINYSHRFRREANPDQDQNKDGDRGGVEVQVNRERNQGTRVDATATGKIWESRDGNGRLEAQGHYGRTYGGRQGTGRPEYGGSINYSHRFRREANPDQDQNKDGDRGGVEVQVNRERNQGTRVDATATGKIWESRDGNGRLEAQGHYGRTYGGRQGTGRPEYGGSINYSHRFRREANPDQDQNKDGGRGGVEVQVNRERNQGTRVDATATGKIWESRDGNGRLEAQGHYGRTYGGRQGTGRPEYGGSINYSHRFRREANPDQDQNKDGGRGGVEVQVNRERNQGTRVDATATGKIWESRDGNGRLEAQGHYGRTYGGRQGTGRPEYGGSINYSHRFRREANPDQDQNKDGGRGGVEVQVNRERNQGTRVDATATGKIWESRDGNGRLEAQGHYGRTYGGRQGTGRPEYGGSINYSHRFRREANPDQDQNKDGGRGRVDVQVNRERNQGTRVDATATGKIWESRDGNGRLEAQGHYGRTYGGRQGTGRPEYGGSINYSHRFRREANPDQDQNKDGGRGGVEVQVNRERNQGTRVDATATGKIWESRDGNGRLEAQGHYGRTYGGRQGTGRPEYGGSINYSHRFRREANPDQDQNKDGGRGGVEVQVNRERNQGTRVDATATGKIWESRDGNGRLEAQGHYGRTYGGRQGTGRPEYGGSINYSHRFRREANPDQDQNKDGGRGGVEVQVNRERNQGTRVDATATGKIWESRDGNGRLEAQGHYGRTYGGRQGTGRPEYGGSINYSHRFRREANPDQDQNKDGGRGRVDVQVNRETNQGTRVDATATGKIWESRDGNGRLEAQGHYGRTYGGRQGTGRPEYGGSINYSHSFGR